MVSGWDKHPPDHEPDIGPWGRFAITLFMLAVAATVIALIRT
jgi:hypothetical protein